MTPPFFRSNLSTQDLLSQIEALGIAPPDQNAFAAIERNCFTDLCVHLLACREQDDSDGRHGQAVEGLVACLSMETGEALRALGLRPTYNALAIIGNRFPRRFLSAIQIARDPNAPRRDEARTFLNTTLTSALNGSLRASSSAVTNLSVVPQHTSARDTRQQAPAPLVFSAPPERQQQDENVTPLPSVGRPSVVSAPQSATTSVERGKVYQSQHVYGAGFALCFNAGEWDGKPGVMVDAAVSVGPRNYDWQGAVHLWLDSREIAAVLAVFRKRRRSVEFSAHGVANDKSFSLSFQGGHFYAKVSAKNKGVRGVKILPTDATPVSVLFLRQLGRAYPDIPLETVLDLAMACNEEDAGSTAYVA